MSKIDETIVLRLNPNWLIYSGCKIKVLGWFENHASVLYFIVDVKEKFFGLFDS